MIRWRKHDFCRRRTSCASIYTIISNRDFNAIARFRNDDYFPLKTWSEIRFFNFRTVFLEIYSFVFYKLRPIIVLGHDEYYKAVCQKRFVDCHFFSRYELFFLYHSLIWKSEKYTLMGRLFPDWTWMFSLFLKLGENGELDSEKNVIGSVLNSQFHDRLISLR